MTVFWPAGVSGPPRPCIASGVQTRWFCVVLLVTADDRARIEAVLSDALAAGCPVVMPGGDGVPYSLRPDGPAEWTLAPDGQCQVRFDAAVC